MRQFGINVVSLWPHSTGSRGAERSIGIAKDAGYNGIQALPMRGWDYSHMRAWSRDVIAFEDAFMFGPLWQAVLRQLGILKPPAPLLLDWLLFGKAYSSYFSNAIQVRHDARIKRAAVEINPALSKDPEIYLDLYRQGYRFCWDTWHIRQLSDAGGTFGATWVDLLKYLPDDAVSIVHLHLSKTEIPGFLKRRPGVLTEMLQQIGTKFVHAPIIVEIYPPMKLTVKDTVSYFRDFLAVTKFWLSD